MDKEKEREQEKDMVGSENKPSWNEIGIILKVIFIGFVVAIVLIGGLFALIYFLAWFIYPPLRVGPVVISLIR